MTNSCCNVSQTFAISYLTYQNSTFTTSIKKNEKASRFKNFRQFRVFALHYESAKSAASWENFVLLPDKKAGFSFNRVWTSSQCTKQQQVESDQLFTWKIKTGVTWYKNWYRLPNSCCIASQTLIVSYLTFQSSNFKTLIKKNENLQDLEISANYTTYFVDIIIIGIQIFC